jgi:hypothetical protein
MNSDVLKEWVRRQKKVGCWQHAGLSLVAFFAGLLVLFLTFWLVYAVVWFGWEGVSAVSQLIAGRKWKLSHEIRLACGGVFICLLFIQYFRTDPWHWGEYPDQTGPAIPGLPLHVGTTGALVALLANPAASANMIIDILLSGPRLTVGAFKLLGEARRFRALDEGGCAQLFALLLQSSAVISYEELSAAGWDPWLQQIRGWDGVRFLQKGIMLSSELRTELADYAHSATAA